MLCFGDLKGELETRLSWPCEEDSLLLPEGEGRLEVRLPFSSAGGVPGRPESLLCIVLVGMPSLSLKSIATGRPTPKPLSGLAEALR